MALFLLAFQLTVASTAPVPNHLMPKPPAYYSTRKGATWVYQFGDTKFTYTTSRVVDRPDGSKVVTITSGPCDQQLLVSGDGLFELTGRTGAVTTRRLLSPRPGAKWSALFLTPVPAGPGMVPQVREREWTCTTHRPERVETPAGTFDALRVELVLAGEGRPQRNTRWYAPGVGLVKEECGGTPTMVLKSFTP